MVDSIPVVAHARQELVRKAKLHSSESGPSMARQSKEPFSSIDSEVLAQTEEEVRRGCIVPLNYKIVGVEAGERIVVRDKVTIKRAIRTRRFGIKQDKGNGIAKVRCIDDYHRSKVNATTDVRGRIRLGKISDMIAFLQRAKKMHPRQRFRILKSDFQSAYRMCPINPDHKRFAVFEVKAPSGSRCYRHPAMPFGAVAAVYAWDALGSSVQYIVAKYLLEILTRYVDDLFGCDFSSLAWALRQQVIELVELPGLSLNLEKTPLPDYVMTLLGVQVSIIEESVVKLAVDRVKAELWAKELWEYRDQQVHGQEIAKRRREGYPSQHTLYTGRECGHGYGPCTCLQTVERLTKMISSVT